MNVKAKFLALFIFFTYLLSACGAGSFFAAPTPTALPTPTNDPLYAAKIVQAFWNALNTGDLETAMVYVGEDIKCANFCYFSGRQTFQSYLHGYVKAGYSTKISDLKVVGGIVTYSWELSQNGLFQRRGEGDEMMEVKDGKIVYWENYQLR
jgi:hypothetical protein